MSKKKPFVLTARTGQDAGENAADKPKEFENFESLMRKLTRVPKQETDSKRREP